LEEVETNFERIIGECRDSFGVPPRSISMFDIWRKKMPTPSWVKSSNDRRFTEIFDNQEALLKRGRVVWGAIVQANTQLFEYSGTDCPAAIIYSLDPLIDASPSILRNAANILFSTKGEFVDDEDIQIFADKLADEMIVDLKIPVPKGLTEDVECLYTCIMVHRKHLPDRKLSQGLFPILVNPKETEATMILPSTYWSSLYVMAWKDELEFRA